MMTSLKRKNIDVCNVLAKPRDSGVPKIFCTGATNSLRPPLSLKYGINNENIPTTQKNMKNFKNMESI